MIRQLKITRDTAMKARTTAMNTLKQIIVQAPPVLREALHDLTDHGLLTRCAGLRPGPIDTPIASAKHTLRSLARRWMALAEEIALHDQLLERRHAARVRWLEDQMRRKGFWVVVAWSAFPFVPTDAICYVAGTLRMKLSVFLCGVALGELPIVAFYVLLGGFLFGG